MAIAQPSRPGLHCSEPNRGKCSKLGAAWYFDSVFLIRSNCHDESRKSAATKTGMFSKLNKFLRTQANIIHLVCLLLVPVYLQQAQVSEEGIGDEYKPARITGWTQMRSKPKARAAKSLLPSRETIESTEGPKSVCTFSSFVQVWCILKTSQSYPRILQAPWSPSGYASRMTVL